MVATTDLYKTRVMVEIQHHAPNLDQANMQHQAVIKVILRLLSDMEGDAKEQGTPIEATIWHPGRAIPELEDKTPLSGIHPEATKNAPAAPGGTEQTEASVCKADPIHGCECQA